MGESGVYHFQKTEVERIVKEMLIVDPSIFLARRACVCDNTTLLSVFP